MASFRLELAPDGPITPLTSFVMSAFIPELEEVVPDLLGRHGVQVQQLQEKKYIILLFPPGTSRQEIFPRMSTMQYKIMLPDGYSFTQLVETLTGEVNIALNRKDLPDVFWKANAELLRVLMYNY